MLKGGAVVDQRTAVLALDRQLGQPRRDIEGGQRPGAGGDVLGTTGHFAHQIGEQIQFDRQRLVGRAADLVLEFGELDRRRNAPTTQWSADG